jgi:hypothetical protein
MKKSFLKIDKLSKFHWIAIFVIVISFFTYYGITSYKSMSNKEKPRWMVCKHNKGSEKPLYIKFHKTDKIHWDYKKSKWVKSKNKYYREVVPTIEMHEDRSHFEESRHLWKLRLIYQSDNYYVFYQTTGGFSLWGKPPPVMAQHIIMNRDDLSLLYYENEWIINKLRNRYYDDEEIEKLFDEAGNYFAFYEDIKLSNGKIIKGHKSLDVYQCKEIPGIKPKI